MRTVTGTGLDIGAVVFIGFPSKSFSRSGIKKPVDDGVIAASNRV
jgi:hypothetical protein